MFSPTFVRLFLSLLAKQLKSYWWIFKKFGEQVYHETKKS